MKRSKAVPLIMLGTLGLLTACTPDDDYVNIKQNTYASREDCRKDWGDDDRDCSPNSGGSGYVGPRYVWSHSGGYPMAVNPDGSTRALSNSYLTKPGAVSTARSATTSSVRSSSFSGSRGGFGGRAGGFSSGG